MGTEKQRKEIIERLKSTFRVASEKDILIKREKLIYEICMNYGVTRMKAVEYLNVLKDGKFITEKDNMMSMIKSGGLSVEEQSILTAKAD